MKSLSEPIGVRPGSPTAEVIAGIDLDETAVVTGRYAGVGIEAVRTVTFAGRHRRGLTAITGRHALKAISGVELKSDGPAQSGIQRSLGRKVPCVWRAFVSGA